MITFYYLNRAVVDNYYAQAEEFVQASYEKWISTSANLMGKLSTGSFLKFIGLDLGGAEASGDLKREYGSKITRVFPDEQKLPIIWRYLQQRGELSILTSEKHDELAPGKMLLFEGEFSISERSSDTAMMSGTLSEKRVSIIFSKEHMPPSVFASLMYKEEGLSLSGCGIVMSSDESEILIRPVAFGLYFLETLKDLT